MAKWIMSLNYECVVLLELEKGVYPVAKVGDPRHDARLVAFSTSNAPRDYASQIEPSVWPFNRHRTTGVALKLQDQNIAMETQDYSIYNIFPVFFSPSLPVLYSSCGGKLITPSRIKM